MILRIFLLLFAFIFIVKGNYSNSTNGVITNCKQCPTTCTPLASGSNANQCCGALPQNGTAYCDTYCVETGRTCCGCNYIENFYSCVSCLNGEFCNSNGQNGLVYYCTSSITKLIPSILTILCTYLFLFP